MRWTVVAVLTAFAVTYVLVGRERTIPPGVVLPNIIATPMSEADATTFLATMHATATVEEREGELSVRVSAATFPVRREGQLALAQQYARADELIQRRKRPITFLDASGGRFARSDPATGVTLTR